MVITNNQDPVNLKLNKDNVLEISFLPKSKYSDFQQDQIWIPPPAKTSRRLAGSQKYPKNNIFINIPADGAVEKTNDQTLRIALGKNEKIIQEKHIIPSAKEDDKALEFQEQTQRVRGTFQAQEHVLEEAEELLKEHENKQKVLSKYCRALKKNMQDIAKSIKELENQNKVLRKTKSTEKTKMCNNNVKKEHRFSSSSKQKIVHEEVGTANISQDENTGDDPSLSEEYSPIRKRNDFDKRVQKQKLKRTCSIENVSIMYLPIDKSTREESEEESNKTVQIKDKTRKQMASHQCIPTENLMMKLSDNMRKTKLLIDSVYQEDETVDTMQKKYVSEVEKLYREQQELLEKIYQTLDKTNSDVTTRSSESFQIDNVQNHYANTTERSSAQEEMKEMQRKERMSKSFPDIHLQKETKSLEDRLEHADKKLTTLKKELETTKRFQSKYKPEIDEQEYPTIHKNLENKTINKLSAPIKFLKNDDMKSTPQKTGYNNILKNDDYACQTEITQVVRQLPSNISGKFNITNDPKTESVSKNDSYVSETKITQKLRFLPLKAIEKTMKTSTASPITEILKDINKSIDNVMPFCKYILPGAEYLNTEEGSLTTDEISYKEVPQKEYYDRDSSKTDNESTKILERTGKDKIQKHQVQMESNKRKENGRMKFYFDPEGHALVNDNTKYKVVAQKSYNKNDISKLQDKTRKELEYSDNNRTRQKYQTQKDDNQYIENRGIADFDRKPTDSNGYGSSQSFTQLSTMEECDCSGECTDPRHFNEFSEFQNPSQMKDKSKQKTKHSTLTKETLLEGSIGIDDDTTESKSDYQNKKLDPPEERNKTKEEEKLNFFVYQSPLAESTKIDDGTSRLKNDYQDQKSDSSGVKNNTIQENKLKYPFNQTPLAESTRIDDNVLDSENGYQNKKSDSPEKWNDQPIYRRHMQTTLNEFVYSYPKMPKEKFPDSVFASTPKKVPPSVNRGAKNATTAISNMEKASMCSYG
ncbi:reticulocyte-binding protein homolog 2a-like [Argiope bruennichi]|uniref:reticulocyte-binding protein homolog 2a-like n=1 Tax=Argiope bruennichi TaxID=94029 RepID=UPI002494D269|nr:reticulocyte-binding protein homolog 2a-like [Argiope bruennichi]